MGLFDRFAPCVVFVSPPTHLYTKTTQYSQHYFFIGHTPSPNWLGSRISPELLREKEVLRFDPDLHVRLHDYLCDVFSVFYLHNHFGDPNFNFRDACDIERPMFYETMSARLFWRGWFGN